MDRNLTFSFRLTLSVVALRKESVDRNFDYIIRLYGRIVSLSARRAWIEITGRSVEFHLFASLSARRAWIEIICLRIPAPLL